MSALIDFIFELLWACCLEFRLFVATLGMGLAVPEHWRFGIDQDVMMNRLAVLSIALFGGIFLYRRFWNAMPEAPDHSRDNSKA